MLAGSEGIAFAFADEDGCGGVGPGERLTSEEVDALAVVRPTIAAPTAPLFGRATRRQPGRRH